MVLNCKTFSHEILGLSTRTHCTLTWILIRIYKYGFTPFPIQFPRLLQPPLLLVPHLLLTMRLQKGSGWHYTQRLIRLLLVQTEHPMDQLVLLRVLHHSTSLQSQIAHDP